MLTKFTLRGRLSLDTTPEKRNGSMHMQVANVLPQLVAEWLTRNTGNHPLSKSAVEQLVDPRPSPIAWSRK
ncbi:hypothetical protein ABZZ20_09315 [Streptomyces sp. NPDC006430]|uniref:hypothetical protein n=1 Tax=Streptomyces sp. NPDC006430 TaxID=3154299 RepID=UPI0033A69A3C